MVNHAVGLAVVVCLVGAGGNSVDVLHTIELDADNDDMFGIIYSRVNVRLLAGQCLAGRWIVEGG